MMTKHADSLVDDLFTTKEETYEKPLFMENEEELVEMGFNTKIASHYKEQNSGFPTKLIYKGFPTNKFFDYYLDHSSKNMLEVLKEHKEQFRENQVKKLEKYEIKEESFKAPDMNTIEAYIERNAELIQKNTELAEELITTNNWVTYHEEIATKYMAYTKFLYDFMGKMEFRTTIIACEKCGEGNSFSLEDETEEEDKITDDEVYKLTKIKEDVKNV